MSDQNDDSQIDDQLEELSAEAGTLIEQAKYRSSYGLFGELRQRAKRERRLYHYVLGTFHQMDQAQYLYEFQTMRERAIELIALRCELVSTMGHSIRSILAQQLLLQLSRSPKAVVAAHGSPPSQRLIQRQCLVQSRCIDAKPAVILASEDIGNADPQALQLAMAATQACEFIGLPECQLTLSQTVIYLACSEKSNSATTARRSVLLLGK